MGGVKTYADSSFFWCRLVQTDMGNGAAQAAGLEQAETTVEDSVAGMTDIVSFAPSIP